MKPRRSSNRSKWERSDQISLPLRFAQRRSIYTTEVWSNWWRSESQVDRLNWLISKDVSPRQHLSIDLVLEREGGNCARRRHIKSSLSLIDQGSTEKLLSKQTNVEALPCPFPSQNPPPNTIGVYQRKPALCYMYSDLSIYSVNFLL